MRREASTGLAGEGEKGTSGRYAVALTCVPVAVCGQ